MNLSEYLLIRAYPVIVRTAHSSRECGKARSGEVDLIITKSISRFARNTVTVLKFARELKKLGVGIF